MSEAKISAEFSEAALEVQRFLSGDIAPMMVADTFEMLAGRPPELAARIVLGWIHAQLGPGGEVSISDLIFHALSKINLLGEHDLVAPEVMSRLMATLGGMLVGVAPAAERDELRTRISHIGEVVTSTAPKLEFLHRQGGTVATGAVATAGKPAATSDKALDRGMRKLGVLLERLGKLKIAPGGGATLTAGSGVAGAAAMGAVAGTAAGGAAGGAEAPSPIDPALLAQVLTTVALESRSAADLELYLARVREQGLTAPIGEVFRTLGRSLPGWTIPTPAGATAAAAPPAKPIEAMNKLVELAPDAVEAARRLGEMVYAAIEQFNDGRLAQAVAILDAASRLLAERKTDAAMVASILGKAQESLAEASLKKFADNQDKHALLRRVLEFFPAYRPDGIIASLEDEQRRDRRKLLLELYECHGDGGRAALFAKLEAHGRGEVRDPHGWLKRNLVFLLRRLPEAGDHPLEAALPFLAGAIAATESQIVVKEAIGALSQLKHEDAEEALIARLKSLERDLTSGSAPANEPSWEILDRLCAAIVRQATPRAIRTLVGHAFSRAPNMGDTLARLDHLSWQDLSVDAEQLVILVKTIHDGLPSKVLGFVRKRSSDEMVHLVRAVSGTPTAEVRAVLDEVKKRYDGKGVGEEAAKALAKLEPKPRAKAASEALSGDLELFALPNLLQSLADSQASGELVLFDRAQGRQGSIGFAKGLIRGAEAGKLRALAAVYWILEKPFPGTFVFRSSAPGSAAGGETHEVMGVMLEGLRRHDEYNAARAMVPDGIVLEPTGLKPTQPEDETDGEMLHHVWKSASTGVPPETSEGSIETDPYRVRRMYAHWVETGSLRPKSTVAPSKG
jgi:hypothetical protein